VFLTTWPIKILSTSVVNWALLMKFSSRSMISSQIIAYCLILITSGKMEALSQLPTQYQPKKSEEAGTLDSGSEKQPPNITIKELLSSSILLSHISVVCLVLLLDFSFL